MGEVTPEFVDRREIDFQSLLKPIAAVGSSDGVGGKGCRDYSWTAGNR